MGISSNVRRTPKAWRTVALLLFGAALLSLVVRLGRHDQFTIDTTYLVNGAHRALDCVGDGVFAACGFHPRHHWTDVHAYPLLQYLPTFALVVVGVADATIISVLAWANTAAVVIASALVVRYAARRGGTRLGFLAFVAMVSGMLVSYAGATVGEPLAMLAILVACLLAISPERTPWLAAATFFAVIGKETVLPVVVLYVLGFVLLGGGPRSWARHKLQLAAVGAGLGVAANLLFNVFRYGDVGNLEYLGFARPTAAAASKSFVSLLVSPNAGLLWFWFMAFAAVSVVAIVLVRNVFAPRREGFLRRQCALGAILAGFVVGVASLGFWWMPFGWYSWGPRLLLPLVPPLFIAAATILPPMRGWAWKAALGAVAMAGILLVPNVAFAFAPEAQMPHWLATVAEQPLCFDGYDVHTDRGFANFHHCLMRAAWRTSSMPLIEAVKGATDDDPMWFWATVVATTFGGVLFLVSLRRTAPTRGDPTVRASARDLVPAPS